MKIPPAGRQPATECKDRRHRHAPRIASVYSVSIVTSLPRLTALNQARNSLRSGDLANAQQLCLQLLKSNRSDPDALNTLGTIALQMGRLDDAAGYYERAIKACPREGGLHINLGKVRLNQGHARQAIESFERALKLSPGQDMALAGKSEALNYLGEVDRARKALEPTIRAGREGDESTFVYSTLLQQTADHAAAVELLARHLANPAVTGLQRYRLGLLLGKSHESLGNFAEAFAAYEQANAAGAVSSRFDPEAHVARMSRLIEWFSPQHLQSFPKVTGDSELPIFIVGVARSGTTLIEQIIQSHPQAFGGGEVFALDQMIGNLSQILVSSEQYPMCLSQLSAEAANQMSYAYISELRKMSRNAARIVDKNLRNFQHIGLVSKLFPRARIIHCRRDILDTALSCYASPLAPTKHGYKTSLAHLGTYFGQYQRLMSHWESLGMPMLQVQYEELVANQETLSRAIIDYCGLSWDDRCLRFHESKRVVRTLSFDQVRQPMYDKSIGRHKNFEAQLAPLRSALKL